MSGAAWFVLGYLVGIGSAIGLAFVIALLQGSRQLQEWDRDRSHSR